MRYVYLLYKCTDKNPVVLGVFKKEKLAKEKYIAIRRVKEIKMFIEEWPLNVTSFDNFLDEEEEK